ncbi:hypothetical protein [Mycoplasma sp. 1018B]|uniref:hypothetical protein n=1 Tax=Mycoplasma sp. 1018B TaxID=2967302 RepID=UPI00211C7B75|nr:hypothetical protein [Mycoplasma sp. 1018B]UUM19472.1 hypothetical protein NPA14_01230 [Mycoplasma sp. 1018B]
MNNCLEKQKIIDNRKLSSNEKLGLLNEKLEELMTLKGINKNFLIMLIMKN